jgi:hypothetical protein
MSKQFLIHTFTQNGRHLRSEIWDSKSPHGLGFPFRWIIEKTPNGIRIRDVIKLRTEEFPDSTLYKKSHSLSSDLAIQISQVNSAQVSEAWRSQYTPHPSFEAAYGTKDTQSFKKTSVGSMSLVLATFLISSVVSTFLKPKEEVMIPPQYAKLIMTPPVQPGSSQAQTSAHSNDSSQGKAVNIVKAFQSKEVQKSTQKLLSKNVLTLLTQSNLVSNRKTKSALQSLFHADSKDKSRSIASLIGVANAAHTPVQITTLGGGSGGNGQGTGNSVGYGKGEKAGVQGQGNSFVDLNTPDSIVEEGLSKDEVGKVIHAHLGEVRYCYESAMIKNPSLQGKLIIDFMIQGTGRVKTAKINNSNLGDYSLDQCIISHLVKWVFPHPKGGVNVAVTYPFIFKSLEK